MFSGGQTPPLRVNEKRRASKAERGGCLRSGEQPPRTFRTAIINCPLSIVNCPLSIRFEVEPAGSALHGTQADFAIQRITLAGLAVYQGPALPCVALRVEAQADAAFLLQVEAYGDALQAVHALDGEGFPSGYGIDRHARTFLPTSRVASSRAS